MDTLAFSGTGLPRKNNYTFIDILPSVAAIGITKTTI
jgi:hypothetical protein